MELPRESSTSATTTSSSSPKTRATATTPETVEAADLIEGQNYFIVLTTAGGLYRYNIHDLVRCVGFHGTAPLIEFLNKGAHFSSLTGEKLSEHQVIAAVEAAQQAVGLRLKSYLLLPSWGDPPSTRLLVEDQRSGQRRIQPSDWPRRRGDSFAGRTSSTRTSARPSDSAQSAHIRLSDGSWSEFQKRRLARSGGTVEQYKQPHLIPDLDAIESFPLSDSVSS